jgi:pyruvate dehydrogenase E1 component beta subunit
MTEGTIAKWLKNEGDNVASGDILAEIETDKATMEVEAIDDGTLGKILVGDGVQNVAVNTPIALILEEGEDASVLGGANSSLAPVTVKVAPTPAALDLAPTNPILVQPMEYAYTGPTVNITVREALRDAMAEEMRIDENIFLMGEEVAQYQGAYKISQGLLDEFGEKRVVDTPITEHGFTGLGVGAAFGGLKPIVEFMTFNFALQALDQIINSAAKTNYMSGGQMGCPIVFRGANGAAARVGAQHSQCFASWYAHIPGMKVVIPYSAEDAKGLLKSAIRDPNPVIVLENEILYGQTFDVPDDKDFTVPIGLAKVERAGNDVTLVAYGFAVGYALDAAAKLAEEGISAEVINLRSIRPLDMETVLKSIRRTNRAVTVEEGFPIVSVGGEIAAQITEKAFDDLDAPVLRVAGKDVPMPYAANLEKLALPNADEVVQAAKSVCYR